MEANDKNDIRAFAVDAGTQRVLTEALAGRGAQVQRGDIGTAIKTLAAESSPRLIFVDLDGSEFPAGRIHELAGVCELGTLVVAISSNDTARFTRELLAYGVSDYLPKPVSVSDVHDAVATALKNDDTPARLYAGRGGRLCQLRREWGPRRWRRSWPGQPPARAAMSPCSTLSGPPGPCR